MNDGFLKKINLIANICLVIALFLVIAFFIINYFKAKSTDIEVKEGTKLSISGVQWSAKKTTLILALHRRCRYCAESAGFYRYLQNEISKSSDIQLIALMPGDIKDNRKYLDDFQLTDINVKQLTADELKVKGTPTLILVNSEGEVTNVYLGKLNGEEESEIMKFIND